MAITAASIEANGWVLALTVSGGNGSFASYALNPDGTPALTLTGSAPGFDVTGGIAVANAAKPRSWTATKPLRKPSNPSNAGVLDAKVVDESVASGGSFVVRIALSNWVYASDTALTLTAIAGWRSGEGAATIAVANGSTAVFPAPISRWVDVPYRLQRGSFEIECLPFGFAPQGNQPVAAVKFTVTDGTNVATAWSTALGTSTQYGDALRCYRVTIDPATATPAALTPGLLRVDRTVYPFIGAAWTTDPAGTRAMTALSTDGFKGAAQAPFAVAYDPTGGRYPFACVYVDFTNGTTIASAAMVGAGSSDATALSAARGVVPGARAKDVTTAVQALYLANLSFGAANGQPAQARILDGQRIVLAPQIHANGMGTTAVTYAPTSLETYLRIEGDPADSNPRATVVLRTANNGGPDLRTSRVAMANMTVELGYYLYQWAPYFAFDNIEFRGATGFSLSGATPVGGTVAPTGYLGLHFTRSRLWKSGKAFDSSFGGRAKLVRKCEWTRNAESPALVTGRLIGEVEDGSDFSAATGYPIIGTKQAGALASFTDAVSVYDSIMAFNDLRGGKGRLWNSGGIAAAYTAYPAAQHRRQVVFGNVMERIGSSADCMFNLGEQEQADMAELILEANSFAGERTNLLYNDSSPAATVAATDAQAQNSVVSVRFAGNIFAWHPTKHDRFDDPTVKAQRVAAGDPRQHGFRPYNIACWAGLYGVGQRDNVNLFEAAAANSIDSFAHEYEGLNCRYDAAAIDPKFTDDESAFRLGVGFPAATGLGNYKPLAGSPALARVANANSDRDVAGIARVAPFTAGAFEATVTAFAVVPASARSVSRAATTLLGWTGVLAVSAARSATRSSSAGLGLGVTIGAAGARHITRAGAAGLTTTSGSTALLLAPGGTTHVLRDGFTIVLQPAASGSGSVRTIIVPDDFRVHSITLS